jgi:putative glutamine amidotransferase
MPPHSRPLIGITTDFVPANQGWNARIGLDLWYSDAVLAAGALPVLLPPLRGGSEGDDFLDRLEGVLLSDRSEPATGGTPAPADGSLVRLITGRRVPVLGIGAGMHQLNAACGGSVFADLPGDRPQSLPHRDPGGGPYRHAVLLEPATRLAAVFGSGEVRVPSCHHQAVCQAGAGLRVSARAPDGIIEAIEAVDPDWFCLGVQWHPTPGTGPALRLFECFIQACREPVQPLRLAA